MKNHSSVVCVIPSRSQGDQINNLNFLHVGNKMLLEYSIISAIESRIFEKIYVIFDNAKLKNFFEKKYNIHGIVNTKRNVDFTKLIKKYKKKYFDIYSYICVLFPNSPFKNQKTLRNMYLYIKKNDLNFLVSGCVEKNKHYFKNSKGYIKISEKKNMRESKIYFTSGGINFFKSKFDNYDDYTNNIKSKNFYTLNHHEGFSIYTLYDLILASTINDIDYSIFTNLLKKR
jgi:CMP-N-acetylneuraminic acid synthetase